MSAAATCGRSAINVSVTSVMGHRGCGIHRRRARADDLHLGAYRRRPRPRLALILALPPQRDPGQRAGPRQIRHQRRAVAVARCLRLVLGDVALGHSRDGLDPKNADSGMEPASRRDPGPTPAAEGQTDLAGADPAHEVRAVAQVMLPKVRPKLSTGLRPETPAVAHTMIVARRAETQGPVGLVSRAA